MHGKDARGRSVVGLGDTGYAGANDADETTVATFNDYHACISL